MSEHSHLVAELQAGRERFLALVEEVRPDLHRYCARMTGSVSDGEDVVQDTLARAYYELPELRELRSLRSWLFRIAHNRAIDFVRARASRLNEPIEAASDLPATDVEPDAFVLRDEAVRVALSRFVELPALQRSCVILKDVLGHSLEEIATMLEASIPAIKAALHRGRTRLSSLSAGAPNETVLESSATVVRYTALFNSRDWDGVRSMLVADVKLDLVSRWKRAGREDVSSYFTNYDKIGDWRFRPAWLEGREVLAVFRNSADAAPSYFVHLTVRGDRVAEIRDYRYVNYILQEANLHLSPDADRNGEHRRQ